VTLIATALFLILGFTVQSAFGFGVALISIPLLTLVLPITQITPLLAMLSMLLSISILRNNWRLINRDITWRILLTASIGVPIGVAFLVYVNEGVVKMVLGAVVVLSSLNALLSLTPSTPMPAFAIWPFGLVIGILGAAYNLLGAPLVLCLQWARLKVVEYRATIHGIGVLLNVVIMAFYGASGLLSKATLINFSAGLIPMLIGGLLGNIVVQKVNAEQFQKIVYAILLVMGFSLIVSGFGAL